MNSEQRPEYALGLDTETIDTWYFTTIFQLDRNITIEQILAMGEEDCRLTREGFRLAFIHDTKPFNQLQCMGNHFGTQQEALAGMLDRCRHLFEIVRVRGVQLKHIEMNVSEIIEGILEPYFPAPMSTDEFIEGDLTLEALEKMLESPEPPMLNVTSHALRLNLFP